MSNIIDSIQLSGVTYQIQGSGGGGVPESTFTAYTATTDERISQDEEVTAAGLNALNDKITPTVELTQAQYDALVDKDPNTYYIITDAQAVDLTNYYTKSETNTLLGGKQATLVSGTNIKTINNESILGSGNIDIQGGSTYTAGRGISITTGATADTVSFDLPISAATNGSILIGVSCSANREKSFVGGQGSIAQGEGSFAFGQYCKASQWSIAVGNQVEANITSNTAAFGKCNKQNGGKYEPESATTLFSVGNGTAHNARHNAFEIRQNGDIYLTKDGQDVKLQDQLGGSSITVDTALDSGSTNPVENRVIYNKIDEVEQVTARALNVLNESLSGKQDTLSAGTNITISGNVISAEGGGGKAVSGGTNISITTGATADTINCTLNISNGTGGLSIKSNGASSASANHTAAFGQNTKATNVCAFAEGWGTTASGGKSHSEGDQTTARGSQSHAEGSLTQAIADHSHSEGYASSATSRVTTMVGITTPYGWNTRHSEGYATIADNGCTHTEGLNTKALNVAEHSSGAYNISYTASTTWGDSGNTLFSVGNGTAEGARHNAFEIRQNGDIYLSLNGQDVKLQDNLGGGTVDQTIISGSTNAVASGAVYDQLGGLKLVKLSQAEYNALATKDSSTLYIIVN